MRTVALLLNTALVFGALYIILTSGGPSRGEEYIAAFIVLAAPISALTALLLGTPGSWFALYVERKRLEEQQKIDALREKN